MTPSTLTELFLHAAGHEKPDCLMHKVDGEWRSVSTAELVRQVRQLAKTLRDLGVERGDRVALMAENGPHWPLVDFASLSIGAVLVPIYPTQLPDQAAYVANDSGAKVVFAEGRERIEGLLGERADLPHVEHFVLIEAGAAPGPDHLVLDELVERGADADPAEFETEARRCRPDDLATFIYTSGTTGKPKGVMLTHGNIASNIAASAPRLGISKEWRALSFLPLSHSFERTVDYVYFLVGATIAYAESIQTVAQDMKEVRPHVFVSVPRVYEKVLAKVNEKAAAGSAVQQAIFNWAIGVGRDALAHRLQERRPGGIAGLKVALADKLVFGKIRANLGGEFRRAVSGGAPLSRDVAEFFWGAGIPIYVGYGLTETSPVLTVNAPGKVKLGTVGSAIPGVELRIADDGEILARGPNIMRGYYNLPEETAEAIDPEGWFHTGDIGEIDDEGFLAITDRKKELIVNAYGKNVAPSPIEGALKGSAYLEQAMVIGDKRKFLAALLVPSFEALRAWAAKQGVTATSNEELVAAKEVQALVESEIERINHDLARYEQVHAFRLLPAEWTLETGELTPTQKIKRRVIMEKYGAQVDAMYAAAEKRD